MNRFFELAHGVSLIDNYIEAFAYCLNILLLLILNIREVGGLICAHFGVMINGIVESNRHVVSGQASWMHQAGLLVPNDAMSAIAWGRLRVTRQAALTAGTINEKSLLH